MFLREVKSEIKERAEYKSELSGESDRPLHCSHFNHNKKDPEEYNSVGMGFLITDIEHHEYHHRFLKNPECIGLEKKENKSALRELIRRIHFYDLSTAEEIAIKTSEAKERWDEFFEEKDSISSSPRSRQAIPPLAV